MGIDKSLIIKSQLLRRRSVLSRTERLQALLKDGRWNEGESVFGLPKVRTAVTRRKVKKEKEKEVAPAVATAEAAAASSEKPSAGGEKPAAPAAKPSAELRSKPGKGAAPK
ncbi:MAG TPA: small basic protein [Candidatus Brocadiia bacterium]|nr:small basic protein [Planctomycetota bacterium]MDO8092149.1 small basic protein [Candidatus Brocadiales bacterium]